MTRMSVGLTSAELTELTRLKNRHQVSMAWLGRQAIIEFLEKYKNEDTPLPLTLEHRRAEQDI